MPGESPYVQGDKITWWDEDSVIVYNMSTGKEIKIVNVSTPAIYCDNLVYVRSKSVDGHPVYSQTDQYNSLFLYNLSTHKEVQLITYQYAAYSASIYGNKIVWGQANQKNSSEWSKNISIYDISTKRVSDISITGRAGGGKIYGNIVVWMEHQNGSMNVYMRDIAKHKTRQVTFDGNSTHPDVYGSRIVWENICRKGEKNGRAIFICTISQLMRQLVLQTALMQVSLQFTMIKLYIWTHEMIQNTRKTEIYICIIFQLET